MVLDLVVMILLDANFRVLSARSGLEAIAVAERYQGTIDLLLSDVKMPGMSGPDVGSAIKRSRPDIRVMFMSGFAGGDMLVLNYGWAYIQKPFVPETLVEMVRVVLDSPNKSQGGHKYDTRKDEDEEVTVKA